MTDKLLIKNAFFSFVKAFLTLFFPLISFPYASRILLPEGIGKVNFAISTVSYFTMLSNLGITSYATRECAKYKNNKIELTKFTKEILSIQFICIIISLILFFISIFTIPKLFAYRTLLLIFSLHIVLNIFTLDWLYYAIENVKIIPLFSFIFQLLSLIYLFCFVKTKDDLIPYAIFGIIPAIGTAFSNTIYSTKYISYKEKIKLNLKKHIPYIFTFFGMTVVTNLFSILDTSMLGFLSIDYELGIYTASIKINKMVIGLVVSLFAVLLPRLHLYYKDNKNQFISLCQKSLNIVILLAIPISMGLYILSDPLIYLFCGSNYSDSVNVMQIMTPIVCFIGISNLLGTQILPAISKEKLSLLSYGIGCAVNVIFNIILIPNYGAIGAAIATLIAEFITLSILVFFNKNIVFNKNIIKSLIQSVFSALLMLLILELIKYKITNAFLKLILLPIIGMLIYAICLYLLKNPIFYELLEKFKNVLKKLLR